MKETYLLYGEKKISIRVPDSVDILESREIQELCNVDEAIRNSLAEPIGTQPLQTLLHEKQPKTVAITISDITRAVPNQVLLPYLLDILEKGAVKRENITLIVGTGMHRASTREEHISLVGEHIYQNYRVIDHNARDETMLTRVSEDPPVSVNSEFLYADFKIVTGFIEPHFMAGYSGGRKGVCPALVDLETIQQFHGFETLSSPLADAGILEGNPCHEIALSIAKTVGIDFLFNVTLNRNFRISGIFCGDMEAAHYTGCKFVADHATCSITGPYDLVVTSGGGNPLDCNYYQSIKGMCMALPALKKGSPLLEVSECREGIGSQAFRDLLVTYNNHWQRFLEDIEAHKDVTRLDQWEFQMLCRVLEVTGVEDLYFLSHGIVPERQRHLCCTSVPMQEDIATTVNIFIEQYIENNPDARIALIPSGPYTIIKTE
jgi:nickel-dependent lactate racemase